MKMVRKFTFTCSVVLLCASVMAQNGYKPATEVQQKEIVSKITAASVNMKSMQCDFTQVKELSFMDDKVTSEGKMYFKKDNKIRWEYSKPYKYVFSMDGQNVRMTSGEKTNKIPVGQSKMFSEISRIMIGGIGGGGLVDSPDFTTQFLIGGKDCKIVLTPQKKEVKNLFSTIHIYANLSDSRITTVELVEKTGDKTTIHLKNIQINATIDDKIFSD